MPLRGAWSDYGSGLLKGRVSMLFIAHQLPKGLNIDAVVRVGDVKAA